MNKVDLEMDIANGLSTYKIALKHNTSQTNVRYWLRKFALKTSPIFTDYKKYNKYKTIDWSKCQALIDGGMGWRDLIRNNYSDKSLTWAVDNNKIKLKSTSESLKLAHKNGKVDYSPYRTIEFKKNQSKFGAFKENAGRCKHISFAKKDGKIVKLQGTWEEKLAMFLDEKDIKWERNRVGYKYQFKNKEHQYFPDFYLPTHDVYIEVKGYETERDRAKWNEFPFKLFIVKKQEIQDLTSWWKENKL